jgi:acyl transferase domain-containing protein
MVSYQLDELRNKEHIDRPEYSQPLSTAVQIALIELFRSFGITPKAVVGHSSGEIAAAYVEDFLSLPFDSALTLTFACNLPRFIQMFETIFSQLKIFEAGKSIPYIISLSFLSNKV